MVPMKFSTIFRNRWFALVWAAGVIWLALDVAAPDQPADGNQIAASDAAGSEVTNADVENFAAIVANM
jgi:hypothetical protein